MNKIKGREYVDKTTERSTTLHALLQRYMDTETPKKGARGQKQERNLIKGWQREKWALLPIVSIKSSHITEWRDRRMSEERAASTIANAMNCLSAVFRVAKSEWSLAVENPVRGIARPKKDDPREAVPSDELEKRLVDTAMGSKARWLAYMIRFAGITALRQSEITALRWRDIDFTLSTIRVESKEEGATKSTFRYVPMLDSAVASLKEWSGDRSPHKDDWVFPSPRNAKRRMPQFTVVCGFRDLMDKVARNAAETGRESDRITFHDLRHYGCTRLAPLHKDALDLSKTTGHKTIDTLAIYFNPDPGERTQVIRERDAAIRQKMAAKAAASAGQISS
jgi:integrase